VLLGIVKKDVEVVRVVAEQPEQQRYLPSMMHTVIGRVLQQFSHGHRALLSPADHEFSVPSQTTTCQPFRDESSRRLVGRLAKHSRVEAELPLLLGDTAAELAFIFPNNMGEVDAAILFQHVSDVVAHDVV